MARNGSDVYSKLAPSVAVPNATITSTPYNAQIDDIVNALNDVSMLSGSKAKTGNQSYGGSKITSLGTGTARTDGSNIGNVQDGTLNWIAAGGSADAITATYSPAITTLVDGQECKFRASAANTTTTPTFAPNGLTARTIVKQGGSALIAGDIPAALAEVTLIYNLANTRWELKNPAASTAVTAATAVEILTGTNNTKTATALGISPLWKKGADVASAGTTTFLDDGGFVHITGTTTITDLDFTTATNGRAMNVVFDGILTLTHNGTTLILPGAANITTAAGDRAGFVQDSGDNIICLWYTKASGAAVIAGGITQMTPVATTSGTSIDFTGIPATAKRITVMLVGVSTNGSSDTLLQIGDSGGIETSGYSSNGTRLGTAPQIVITSSSAGFCILGTTLSAVAYTGQIILNLQDTSNTWCSSGALLEASGGTGFHISAGAKATSATLDRVRLTTAGGTATFDAGSMSVSYE